MCVHSFVIGSSLASVACCAIMLGRRAIQHAIGAGKEELSPVCGMTVFVFVCDYIKLV